MKNYDQNKYNDPNKYILILGICLLLGLLFGLLLNNTQYNASIPTHILDTICQDSFGILTESYNPNWFGPEDNIKCIKKPTIADTNNFIILIE